MEITKELQQLAKFSHPIFPVISVYFKTQWADRYQRVEAAAFLATHLRLASALELDSEAARDSLACDLLCIEQWGTRFLSEDAPASAASIALFTCSGADVWVEFPSPVALEPEFTVADRPALRQLARLDADYTNALVVLLEPHRARVCEVVLGEFLAETAFAREAPEAPTPRGWGQMRHWREIRADPERHYREVGEALSAYLMQRPETLIILSGQRQVLTHFRQLLSPHVQQQIIDEVRLDLHDTYDRILQIAHETLREHDRKEGWASVRLLIDTAARGGLAVLGLLDTLAAVNAGLVHKLVMRRDFRRRGWRCLDCDNIGRDEAPPSQCPRCNGRATAMELGEAMVTAVLRHDGFFEPVEPDARLVDYDGLGAFLRQRFP